MFQLLSKILDVIDDPDWNQSLGNDFAGQDDRYIGDYKHSVLLHKCGLYPHDSHDAMEVFISNSMFQISKKQCTCVGIFKQALL
jgi:hypothetical protein